MSDETKLANDDFPDVSKEMIIYLMKRVAVLEKAIKEQDNIDVSVEDRELEDIYASFIDSVNTK